MQIKIPWFEKFRKSYQKARKLSKIIGTVPTGLRRHQNDLSIIKGNN